MVYSIGVEFSIGSLLPVYTCLRLSVETYFLPILCALFLQDHLNHNG